MSTKRCAVRISAVKGTSKQEILAKLKRLEDKGLIVEQLSDTGVTTNFRVIVEKWPTDKEIESLSIWKSSGLVCRPWRGPIQDLTKRNRIRRLISGLHASMKKSDILTKLGGLYARNLHRFEVQPYVFPNQRDKNDKNFIIEISATDKNGTVDDSLTEYCTSLNIRIRPWKGRVHGTERDKPKFI